MQPFKCGPDYIDTIHHTAAAGKQSINLDTFMSSEKHVKEIYSQYSSQADIAVTEGVMGLFDGADKMQGSSAAIAELLNIPVILVVNARSMAYSAAPLLYGFKNFYNGINVVGVIFNFVNTESHYSFLKDACRDVGIESLGYLPKSDDLLIPSRHLGLHISPEIDYEIIIEKLAASISETVDIDRLLEITTRDLELTADLVLDKNIGTNHPLKISIARDEAFSFTYQQNVDVLSRLGHVTWFSPLHDHVLPETDFLYLPGGYPELFAKELNKNTSMLATVKVYCENGGLTYAECGGLMYLGKSIITSEGSEFKMAGVLDCITSMQGAKMTLGYRVANWNGLKVKGHEFHYSSLIDNEMHEETAQITNAKGIETETKLYRKRNAYASYMHIYWGDNEDFIKQMFKSTPITATDTVGIREIHRLLAVKYNQNK